MIDINITVVIQLINFLVTLVVLNYLLIAPIRGIIRERKEKMEGLDQDISTLVQDADSRLAAYEDALRTAREEAGQRRKDARLQAENDGKALVAQAAGEAQAAMQAGQAAVRAEADAAYASLQEQVPALATEALSKFLGKPASL